MERGRGKLLPDLALSITMYSSTSDMETIQTCYRRGANANVVNPRDYDEIVTTVEHLLWFWGETANVGLTA
jgi:hypothetical protein